MSSEQGIKFLNRSEVRKRTGVFYASLWRWERDGRFPRRRRLGPGTVRWREDEVVEWLENRPVVGEAA